LTGEVLDPNGVISKHKTRMVFFSGALLFTFYHRFSSKLQPSIVFWGSCTSFLRTRRLASGALEPFFLGGLGPVDISRCAESNQICNLKLVKGREYTDLPQMRHFISLQMHGWCHQV
jgi:hypothetical protein